MTEANTTDNTTDNGTDNGTMGERRPLKALGIAAGVFAGLTLVALACSSAFKVEPVEDDLDVASDLDTTPDSVSEETQGDA